MIPGDKAQKRLHDELTHVGLRAQATAVGLIQLCLELRRANVIDQPGIERIKAAISEEITMSAPRTFPRESYRREVRARLDRLFAGEQGVGPAGATSLGEAQP